jgi:nucleoporin NUP1
MFKPKKSHNLVLMHEKEEKARLGASKKKRGKAAEEINGTKPYAGVGGMKKLLARRKMEEEQEKEKDAAAAMEADNEEAGEDHNTKTQAMDARIESDAEKIPPIPPPTSNSSSRAASRERSSLRVGRTKTSRSHLSRPAARPVNRFSAQYDDDEGDDHMGEDSGKGRDFFISDEAAERVPVLNVPSSFSFANEVGRQHLFGHSLQMLSHILLQTAPVQHDLSNAKEPPMTTLPFSLSSSNDKLITPLPSVEESVERPAAHAPLFGPPSDFSSTSYKVGSAAISLAPPAPSMVVPPPAPEPAQELHSVSTAPADAPTSIVAPADSVPSFFAKPSFPKSDVSITPPIFGGSTPPVPIKDAENPLWEGEEVTVNVNKPTQSVAQPTIPSSSEPKPPVFGGFDNRPAVSVFGSVDNTSSSSASRVAPPATSSPLPDSSISATVKESEITSVTPLFGAAPKPAEPTAPSFSFNAPAKPAEPPATNQPVFSFGVTKSEPPKEPKSAVNITPNVPVPPPIFGGSPDATSLFKAPQKPVETVVETPKPAFSFGSSTPPAPAAPSIEQQSTKSPSTSGGGFLFGAQENVAQAGFTSTNPFSYGAAPSTPPAGADKKPLFSFGPSTTPALAPAFSSGSSTVNGSASDVSSKPFVFGATSSPTARPVTPPKNEDQECRMEESPTRDMQLNGIGKQTTESRPSLFSFSSTPTTTPFGQSNQSSSTPFAYNAQSTNFFAQKIETKTEQKPALTFGGFGQNQNQASNGFGQKPAEIDQSKNSATSPFSFQPSPTTSAGPSFAFRAPAANNPFSQATQQGGSAPNSPSFNQPASFSFPSPATTSTPFSFNSAQPASPAAANNVNLPSTATPGMFSFGASATPQPTSFGAPAQAPPPGGTLFTIGAPPTAPPGGRQVKRLPLRRGNKR